jgi:replicative DNA helicase
VWIDAESVASRRRRHAVKVRKDGDMDQLPSHRETGAQSVTEVLQEMERGLLSPSEVALRSVPTGYRLLDDMLGGGLHTGDLVLLGGPPGVGKTIAALQWARAVAKAGHKAIFACYEHEPLTLLTRLLALEIGELGTADDAFTRDLLSLIEEGDAAGRGMDAVLQERPGAAEALRQVRDYADRLILVRASGSHTTTEQLADLVAENRSPGETAVLFVDYLQKVPLQPEPATESEKVTRTVEALKDLALERRIPVVLLSAVDAEGMRASRLRLYHLRGSSAIAFESDVVLMLNSKEKAVSKVHLAYNTKGARAFRDWVVMSVEKNRGGPNLVDLEFRKDFRHFRFDPEGGIVTDKLVDERLDEHEL